MQLTRTQFDHRHDTNQLVLGFIGMSNIGKSYWSGQLNNHYDYQHYCCDDVIEEKLGPILNDLGYSGIEDVAKWMQMPYGPDYSINQKQYLALEAESLREAFSMAEKGVGANFIIDTTGSVVHTGDELCQELCEHSLIVYIQATDEMQDEMYLHYLAEPKPVVFGDTYQPLLDENSSQTLARCYKKLLDKRSELYEEYADVTIHRKEIASGMSADRFLGLIRERLPQT